MKKNFIELLKYGFWGCISTGINLALFYAFIKLHMQYIYANVISYIIAVIFSYIFNDIFVFKGNNAGKVGKGIKYFLMRGASIIVDSAILAFLHEICGINLVVSKIVDSALIIISTFLISKILIFKEKVEE